MGKGVPVVGYVGHGRIDRVAKMRGDSEHQPEELVRLGQIVPSPTTLQLRIALLGIRPPI